MLELLKEKRRRYILSRSLPKYEKIFGLLSEKGKILDAGCGKKSRLSEYLLSKNNFINIVGCDMEKSSSFKHKNFRYSSLNLDKGFNFKINFDTIIFADVLEHLKKPEKILEQASKHTNKFIISIPNLDFFMYKIYPKLENPPKGESQHLHHWKLKEFLNLLPKDFKIVRKEYCSDFPEFRWTNYFPFKNKSFFNQTIILEAIKNKN